MIILMSNKIKIIAIIKYCIIKKYYLEYLKIIIDNKII